MSAEQLERARMHLLRERAGSALSDARNSLNRFFGAKVCGKCEGCSGGSCDSCKGKPALSLWDAASAVPSLDMSPENGAAGTASEKHPGPAAAEIPGTSTLPATTAHPECQRPELRPQMSAPDENSRLVHLRQSASDELSVLQISGSRLVLAGLAPADEAPRAQVRPAEDATPVASNTAALRTPREISAPIHSRSGPQVQFLGIRPAPEHVSGSNPPAIPARAGNLPAPGSPASPAKMESPAGNPVSGPGPELAERPAEAKPIHQQPARRLRQTVVENPCAQAIIRIKYSRPAPEQKAPLPAARAEKREPQPVQVRKRAAAFGKMDPENRQEHSPAKCRRNSPAPVHAPDSPVRRMKARKQEAENIPAKMPAPEILKTRPPRKGAPQEKTAAAPKPERAENARGAAFSGRKKRQDAHIILLLLDRIARKKRKAGRRVA